MSNQSEYPTFKLGLPRFDQSTFSGRLRHFLDVTDPRTLFTSKEKLQKSIELIEQYRAGILPANVTDKDLWQAQKIKQAIIHPDTGEKIFMPFRMSGFVPFGSPIAKEHVLAAMFAEEIAEHELMRSKFAQFQRVILYGCWSVAAESNAGADSFLAMVEPEPQCVRQLFKSQCYKANACFEVRAGILWSCLECSRHRCRYSPFMFDQEGNQIGLSLLIRRANSLSPAMKMIIQKFVPFPAVATASTCNVVLMRYGELYDGIEIFDKFQRTVGTSKEAAKKALKETAVTRMVLPAPIFLIPPTIMTFLERTQLLRRRPRLHLPINATVTTLSFALALPVAIALFPQVSSINRSVLEPELQNATSEPILYYNKGL